MKIAIAELNYHTGNFDHNTKKIIDAINKAKKRGAELIVFSELAVCGYPPRDFLEFQHFIELCQDSIENIREATDNIAIIVGAPTINPKKEGKDLLNSAVVIQNKIITNIIHKTLLPTYDIFDEYRYFESNTEFKTIKINGVKIALTICEDIWNLGRFELYPETPMDALIKEKPELMINIAASPFSYQQQGIRLEVLRLNTSKYKLPILYVNHVGAQTELIFDGNSVALNKDGEIIHQTQPFKEALDLVEYSNKKFENIDPSYVLGSKSVIQLMYESLVVGVRDYFSKLGFKHAILGLSGGIDSALVAVLAADALGSENVMALLMPSKFSSDHSITDAVELSENLGINHKIISIKECYEAFEITLDPYFKGLPFNVTEENLQARSRGVLLMAFSNKFGNILLNTSNKSEMAVGYGTLYGDMAGGLSVIGDVYKTQVFEMCKWINKDTERIPWNIINKPPSAELKPNQKDSDSLPPYDVLDRILYEYIENRLGPRKLLKMGFDKDLVTRILKMVNQSEYKRHQTAPILRLSPKAFGMGRRMPIVAKYLA